MLYMPFHGAQPMYPESGSRLPCMYWKERPGQAWVQNVSPWISSVLHMLQHFISPVRLKVLRLVVNIKTLDSKKMQKTSTSNVLVALDIPLHLMHWTKWSGTKGTCEALQCGRISYSHAFITCLGQSNRSCSFRFQMAQRFLYDLNQVSYLIKHWIMEYQSCNLANPIYGRVAGCTSCIITSALHLFNESDKWSHDNQGNCFYS